MATCSSLMSLFETTKPIETSTSSYFQDKLSPTAPDLHFKKGQTGENPPSHALLDISTTDRYRSGTKSEQSLQLCTEGLGSESSDDMDDMMEEWRSWGVGRQQSSNNVIYGGTPKCTVKEFPPPIPSIGKRVCLRSYRENGRFVLREMRIPCKEVLRASREDGRLKLHFVHPVEVERGDDREEEEEVGGD